jgi:hypothetical protein
MINISSEINVYVIVAQVYEATMINISSEINVYVIVT